MSNKPEAPQLADDRPWQQGDELYRWAVDAEDMLRSQHTEIEQLLAQRDELLAALKDMVAGDAEAIAEAEALGVPFPEEMLTAYRRAVAAIAKAEGGAA